MTFADFWSQRLSRSPGFANRADDDVMRITVKALRAELQLAYQAGREDGYQQGSADELEILRHRAGTNQTNPADWLMDVFRRKP